MKNRLHGREEGSDEVSVSDGLVCPNDVCGPISRVVLASALALGGAGCAAGSEAVQLAEMRDRAASLEKDLGTCREKSIESNGQPLMVSFGTLGMKTLKPGKENRFLVKENFDGVVEQTMLIWPPVFADVDIKLSGDAERMVKVPVGSTWGVAYRSPMDRPKETLVIDVGVERYVIFVERR
jgi:hypothetical protein